MVRLNGTVSACKRMPFHHMKGSTYYLSLRFLKAQQGASQI
jgi:hypothetical protein